MPWVKIDDNMPQNPKVRSVSTAARWAYVSSICYAGLNHTDGVIPKASLALVDANPKIAGELLTAGLWESHPLGWYIHDFLKHNRSKERIQATSQSRREAGSKGAANRWQIATDGGWQKPKQTDGNLFLSASASGSLDPSNPPRVVQVVPEAERQNDGNLPSETEYPLRECMDLWTSATGTTVTRMVGDAMESALEDIPADWVKDAIRETGLAGAKSWKYTAAILERWKHEGREVAADVWEKNARQIAAINALRGANG